MDTRFDQMTKILAEGIPRREALWRLGGILFGGTLLASRASADEICGCVRIPVGHEEKGGFATQTDCEALGIPEEFDKAEEKATKFCDEVYECKPECPQKDFVKAAFPDLDCKCEREGNGRWRAVCDVRDKNLCCCLPSCPPGQTRCGTDCKNLNTDNNNCGRCGNACATGQACSGGACQTAGCSPPCGSILPDCCNDTCTSIMIDAFNCGTCGNQCPPNTSCQNGICCPLGQANCSGTCTSTSTDSNNCGGCGHMCGSGMACVSGTCQCGAGLTNCSGTCADLLTDPGHCGSCATACTSGNVCLGGTCTTCPMGSAFCNGTCIPTGFNDNNCGTCGHVCPTGTHCIQGQCV